MGTNTRLSSPNARRRKYVKQAVKLFKNKLFGDNQKDVNLRVVDSNLVDGFPKFTAEGMALEVKPKHYMIILHNEVIPTKAKMLDVLAHEMGHVQQMYAGDLIERDKGIEWRGRFYSDVSLNHSIVANWANRPWEIHAEGVKDFLIKAYASEMDETSKTST